jgi:hypothetical protein
MQYFSNWVSNSISSLVGVCFIGLREVIHRDCKGLVKATAATEFWKLTPASVKSPVVKFPGEKLLEKCVPLRVRSSCGMF